MKAIALAAAVALIAGCASPSEEGPPETIQLTSIASYKGSGSGETGMEIVAYAAASKRVFAINASSDTVDVVDLSTPSKPQRLSVLEFGTYGAGVNSVAAYGNLVAVAVEAAVKTDPGLVVFVDAQSLRVLGQASVGALPDMLTFTPDGGYLLVANEGEPNADYTVDPEGSVSVIDLRSGVAAATVRTASFSAFVGQETELRQRGIRIYGPGANAAKDFEPEYIAVNGLTAYVTLQENNAVAVLDVAAARFDTLLPLGYKDHSLVGNELDPSDRDSANKLVTAPVYGMFEPDATALLTVRGETFLLTANEGDTRDYPPAFSEEVRVGSSAYVLDATAFPTAATLKGTASLGRLTVTNTLGDTNGDGDFDRIYVPGARSFSVWNLAIMATSSPMTSPNAGLAWDSGAQFERITASAYPNQFNAGHDILLGERDNRSDNKGPEPEGIVVGHIGKRDYAFIGLERIGGVMVYDVSNPRFPAFVQYLNTRFFGNDRLNGQNDSGPEGLAFIPADDSPTGKPLLLVGNEVSQTMSVFEIERLK